MHPLTAIGVAMATSPHLWEIVHAAPASTKSPPFPSVEEMESCQNACLGKHPANDLEAQFNCNRECLHFPVSLLPPNPQTGLFNRGVPAGSPSGPFDYPACVQVCSTSEHGNATCTDACQRLLPCWMYCNHEFEHEDEDHQRCLRTCVEDLKNTPSSKVTPNTADLNQVFPNTFLATREATKACSEDFDGHVICADQPKMKVPRGARDQCDMDCDEIQNAHQTYLCKMNCTDKYSIGDVPPNLHARHADINTAESSTVARRDDDKDDDKDCSDYCNANSIGGSVDEIHDRCAKACITLAVCETACEAQGPNDGEHCVVDCIMIGSDAKKDSAVVARDSIPHAQPEAEPATLTAKHVRRQGPFDNFDTCLKGCPAPAIHGAIWKELCHLMVDCHNSCRGRVQPDRCYYDCIKDLPPTVDPHAQADSKKEISTKFDHGESDIAIRPLSKRYTPDQCKWACHEIDDPTNQICYQPCIDAHPGKQDFSIESADLVAWEVIPKLHEEELTTAIKLLNKRYTPEQCKWACHEIDDPTNQICYQPCIDAHPGKQVFSIETAAVTVLQDVKREMSDMDNHQGINISSPILTAEDRDRCTQGCIGYAEADSLYEPEKPCLHMCMGVQACQSRCASSTDHETNIKCGIDCFLTMCQSDSIDCRCVTSKEVMSSNSSAECRLGLLNVTEVRATRDVHADPRENDGLDNIEGALRLREISLSEQDIRDYDGPSTTINLADLVVVPSTTTTVTEVPTMTIPDWKPSGTMTVTVSAGSSLGCKSWQVVWVVVVAGIAGGMFLW